MQSQSKLGRTFIRITSSNTSQQRQSEGRRKDWRDSYQLIVSSSTEWKQRGGPSSPLPVGCGAPIKHYVMINNNVFWFINTTINVLILAVHQWRWLSGSLADKTKARYYYCYKVFLEKLIRCLDYLIPRLSSLTFFAFESILILQIQSVARRN